MAELGDILQQQQQQQYQPGPPASVAEYEQRRQGWLEFLQRPDTRAALLQAGTYLLQPVPPGQTAVGHLGGAIALGAEASGRVGEREAEQAALANELRLREAGLGLQAKGVAVQEKRAEREEELLPERRAGLEALTEARRASAGASEARRRAALAGIGQAERRLGLEAKRTEAQVRRSLQPRGSTAAGGRPGTAQERAVLAVAQQLVDERGYEMAEAVPLAERIVRGREFLERSQFSEFPPKDPLETLRSIEAAQAAFEQEVAPAKTKGAPRNVLPTEVPLPAASLPKNIDPRFVEEAKKAKADIFKARRSNGQEYYYFRDPESGQYARWPY